jgi:hypothetical protein
LQIHQLKKAILEKEKANLKLQVRMWTIRFLTRGVLGNAHHEGLRVDGILQVSTRHRIPNEQKARFT